ncbi:hypothetical protein V6U90_20325 [Micromonospora sp. CPCC 206060]|uniref:hypothetical protein n=1 Tax=Micromonospora sp. CPCC 206060 TaxID=3122406 RepID=UPI002FF34C2B
MDARPTVEIPDFTVARCGYDTAVIHTPIRRAQRALDQGGNLARQLASWPEDRPDTGT